MEAVHLPRVFRSLSDETRLRMLKLLLKRELCVCEITQAREWIMFSDIQQWQRRSVR